MKKQVYSEKQAENLQEMHSAVFVLQKSNGYREISGNIP